MWYINYLVFTSIINVITNIIGKGHYHKTFKKKTIIKYDNMKILNCDTQNKPTYHFQINMIDLVNHLWKCIFVDESWYL